MKWLNDNIIFISFVWWLLQGVSLLLNELRVWLEHNYLTHFLFVLGICLVVISFLLWFIKNKKIILLLGILLLLYSIISLIFLSILFILESHGNNLVGIFLVIPILNILLSILMIRQAKKEIKKEFQQKVKTTKP
jgi:CHASE2 domain-containing sensor protein